MIGVLFLKNISKPPHYDWCIGLKKIYRNCLTMIGALVFKKYRNRLTVIGASVSKNISKPPHCIGFKAFRRVKVETAKF